MTTGPSRESISLLANPLESWFQVTVFSALFLLQRCTRTHSPFSMSLKVSSCQSPSQSCSLPSVLQAWSPCPRGQGVWSTGWASPWISALIPYGVQCQVWWKTKSMPNIPAKYGPGSKSAYDRMIAGGNATCKNSSLVRLLLDHSTTSPLASLHYNIAFHTIF